MATIVTMPRLSDTMTEGTLAAWLMKIGDKVSAGDGLADMETDKAVMTFESFDEGVLLATLIESGDTVPLGAPIAVLGKEGEDVTAIVAEAKAKLAELAAGGTTEDAPAPEEDAEKPEPKDDAEPPEPEKKAAPEAEPDKAEKAPVPETKSAAVKADDASLAPPAGTDIDGRRIPASPLARRIAAERGVDLRAVAGTGPKGRIVVSDLEGLAPARTLIGSAGRGAPKPREDEVVRVTQMRKTIAKRLVEAKNDAPHFYLNITVEADRLVAARTEINAYLKAEGHPFTLSYNDFVQKAVVVALGKHPDVNAGWEGTTIRRFGAVHLGFAVALPEGLITPVIRDAGQKDMLAMAAETRSLAERARAQKLESADYSGNTFCVSNLGMFGIDHFTAIINPPAACILAIGALQQQPVVRDGALAVGHTMMMTLSCDHRVVDGALGAAFMKDLKAILEAPTALLIAR